MSTLTHTVTYTVNGREYTAHIDADQRLSSAELEAQLNAQRALVAEQQGARAVEAIVTRVETAHRA